MVPYERIVKLEKQERRLQLSFIILVCICIFLTAASIAFTLNRVHTSDHKFCAVVNTAIQTIEHPPKNGPSVNKKKLKEYDKLYVKLGKDLGCE